jgi:hypothetical protein
MQSNISQFLDIFKSAVLSDDNFREDVCAIVLEKTKFPIEKKCVTCKNGALQIKVDPYMKTEINFHREIILLAVQEKYPEKNIREIF